MMAHGGLIMGTRKVAQGGQTCQFQWSKSLAIIVAHRGLIMGTRKVAHRGQTCRFRGSKSQMARRGQNCTGSQCTEHGPRKGTETGTWAQSQRQTRLHNPRIPYMSTDHIKAERHVQINSPGGRHSCTTPGNRTLSTDTLENMQWKTTLEEASTETSVKAQSSRQKRGKRD